MLDRLKNYEIQRLEDLRGGGGIPVNNIPPDLETAPIVDDLNGLIR